MPETLAHGAFTLLVSSLSKDTYPALLSKSASRSAPRDKINCADAAPETYPVLSLMSLMIFGKERRSASLMCERFVVSLIVQPINLPG